MSSELIKAITVRAEWDESEPATRRLRPLFEKLIAVVERADSLVLIDWIGKTGVARVNVKAVNDIQAALADLRTAVMPEGE